MADLFVSYKSDDRARVAPLVKALQDDGLSVWWDAHIEGGAGWRQSIERELAAAKCVLVVWSKRSAAPEGEFVHDEASRAKRRGAYLPVRIDNTELPLGFGEKQALSLIGWKADRADPRYLAVLAAARAVVSGIASAPIASASPAPAVPRRALLAGAALGTAALAGGGWWMLRPKAAEAADSIAVLPFANLSGDPAQAYFSDGLAEELRSSLSRIAGLKVAARTSSEKMREADVTEVADKLGVATVLTGSVRRGDGTIRVSTQLLDGKTGLETWSQVYDRPAGDALIIQTSIATSVANALSMTLGKAATMLGGTANPQAYDAYLQAQAIGSTSEARIRAALAAYDIAIAADPDFAVAQANRAITLVDLFGVMDVERPAEAQRHLQQAETGARRAIALAPGLPIAHTALAMVKQRQLDLPGADAAFTKALGLPGGVSRDLRLAADFQSQMGRSEVGLALIDRAIALDPLNPAIRRTRIILLMDARRPDEALAAIDAWQARNPGETISPRTRTRALLLADRAKEALAEAARIPVEWQRLYATAVAYAMLDDRAASDRALAALKAGYAELAAYQIASVHAVRGEADLAFAALEHAADKRDPGLLDLRVDHSFDTLRKDPRLAALEKRLSFPPV